MIDGDTEGWRAFCTCGSFLGLFETHQDALDAHEDHVAGCYEL